MRLQLWILISILLTGCVTVSSISDSQITDGSYHAVPSDGAGKKSHELVAVRNSGDSLHMVPINKSGGAVGPVREVANGQHLSKHSFDIDVLAIVFKYRPEVPSLPSQLTTDFNGNLFLGYRRDWFRVHDNPTAFGVSRQVRQRSFTVGGFVGMGTTFISPWTTNQQTTDEYNGFIFSNGLSTMLGFKSLTVGIAVGWDYLADRDKDIWIYQASPWYGLALSLNLN